MNPPPYILIGFIFLLMGLVVLPSTSKLTKQKFNWKIKGGTQATMVLIGFLLICLVVPQINLQTSSVSINSAEERVSAGKIKDI